MIESFCIACIATLLKIFMDREIIFYQSKIEYVLVWIGAFVMSYSAGLMALWIKDVIR